MKQLNITRFGRVLKLDLAEGRKTMMWGALCMLLLYLFFFWFTHESGIYSHRFLYIENPEEALRMRIDAMCASAGAISVVAMFIFFLIAASTLYRSEQKKQKRIAWLMVPATNLEKFTSHWVYMLVFSVVGGILPFFVADCIHMGFLWVVGYPVRAATDDFFTTFPHEGEMLNIVQIYTYFVAMHAFYLLGGLFFKKFHFIAVSAVVVLFYAVLITIAFQMPKPSTTTDHTVYYLIIIAFHVGLITLFTKLAYWLFCRWQIVTHKFANV